MKQLDDFFFNDTATTEIYTLSLHDALPICGVVRHPQGEAEQADDGADQAFGLPERQAEHGPEWQGRQDGELRIPGLPAPGRAGSAAHAPTASSVNHTVRLPRCRDRKSVV